MGPGSSAPVPGSGSATGSATVPGTPSPPSPGSVRFLLFDLDGTLLRPGTDFAVLREEVKAVFEREGVPREFNWRHILGGIDDAIAWLGQDGHTPGELAALRTHAYALIEAREREGLARAVGIPGVREALDAWRAGGLKLGIYTRTHPEVLRESIAKFDLGGFDVLLSRADGPVKPDPAQVRRALALAGLPAAACLAVGDHVFDVVSARGAGVRAWGVLTGSGKREELLAAGAEGVVDAVPALADVVVGRE